MTIKRSKKPLFTGSEWDVQDIKNMWDIVNKIGTEELGLTYYDPQIEIITYEQMIDAYSSTGMPLMYNHWSLGKQAIAVEESYRKGQSGLAYEMVINTDPMITYIMENNSATMQALVLAHAVVGHGSFFKNNYLFKEWTKPKTIVPYLQYARDYIAQCEQRYGELAVEQLLDAAHALSDYGVDKYKKSNKKKLHEKQERVEKWVDYLETNFKELDKTIPKDLLNHEKKYVNETIKKLKKDHKMKLPEENILYFIEKNSPKLKNWEKEIVRIVRTVAQYFYPQRQTKIMNEGWASFCHHHIMGRLWELNYITEGSYLEFLVSHCGVTAQQSLESKYYSGFNPYALGFAMFTDIKRICEKPTEEDIKWFPDIANTEWLSTLKHVMENYRDESFILQFLSPKVIRDFKMLSVAIEEHMPQYEVMDIHNQDGVNGIRKKLANMNSLNFHTPHIEVHRVDWDLDNTLVLRHYNNHDQLLEEESARDTLNYLHMLWGKDVLIENMNYNKEFIS
jgi:stage V sporulation protein R